LLEVRGCRGVVDCDQHSLLVCCSNELAQITDVETGVAGCFQQEQLRVRQVGELCIVTRGRGAHLDADFAQPVLRDHSSRVIRVGREDDDVARLETHAEHSSNCRHARREAHRGSAFEHAERLFQSNPGRIVEATISEAVLPGVAPCDVSRGELGPIDKRAGFPRAAVAGLEDCSVAVQCGLSVGVNGRLERCRDERTRDVSE
jgi:hypothetical protein